MAQKPDVVISFGAELQELRGQMAAVASMVQGTASQVQTSLQKMQRPAQESAAAFNGLQQSLAGWSREQGQQARIASRLVEPLSGLAEAAGVSTGAMRGLAQVFVEGAAGGVGFGLALEAAQMVVGTITSALKQAKEEAKRTAEALRAIQERVEGLGQSPLQQKMHEVARLGAALEELRQANMALSDSGAMLGSGSAEEARLDAAQAKLREYAERYKVSVGALPQIHAALLREMAAMDSQHLNELAQKEAAESEKASGDRLRVATKTAEELKRLDADVLKERQKLADENLANESGRVSGFEDTERLDLPKGWKTTAQLDAEEAKRQADAAAPILQQQMQWIGQIEASWSNAISGMLSGQMTLAEGIKASWQAIGQTAIQAVSQILAKWASSAVAEAILGKTSAVAQALRNQAVAVTGAMAAMAGVPLLGPGLAAAAGLEMEAMTAPFVAQAGSAAGGWDLPRTGGPFPAILHASEKVLPARQAKGLDVMIEQALAGRNAGGTVTTVNHFHINATDAGSFIRMNRRLLVAELQRATRAGESS